MNLVQCKNCKNIIRAEVKFSDVVSSRDGFKSHDDHYLSIYECDEAGIDSADCNFPLDITAIRECAKFEAK